MDKFQGYLIIGLLLFFVFWIYFLVITYWRKNSIMLSITRIEGDRVISKDARARISKPKEYRKWGFFGQKIIIPSKVFLLKDFFARNPLNLDADLVKANMINSEDVPIFGVKFVVQLFESEVNKEIQYKVWTLPADVLTDRKGYISNIRIVKINNIREKIHEMVQLDNNKELLYKVVVPLALCVLALGMLLFFPKIYEAITSGSKSLLETSATGWQEQINKLKPFG